MQLYLGIVPGIFPWKHEPLIQEMMFKKKAGIIFSYWTFRKQLKDIMIKGLHNYFFFDGPIIIDSGAYSAFNSGIKLQIEDYLAFLSEIELQDSDLIVNLDIIGDPIKSKQNWEILSKKFSNVLPVIHFPHKKNDYPEKKYIGLGGMVPSFKINQKGSVYEIATWIMTLWNENNIPFHGFGIGSPFHQIIFQNYLQSVDWIGWRRNAAVCSCYTPKGSIFVNEARRKKKKGKIYNYTIFQKYAPPFIQDYEMLYQEGSRGWKNRAMWNVWWFLVAQGYEEQILKSKYVKLLLKHIEKMRSQSKNKLTNNT